MSSGVSFIDDGRKIDASLIDYVDLLFNLIGVDITYDEFQKMSDSERKSFIRDIKINRVINE